MGQFEGPVRAHNLLYALGGALAVPVVPTASRYSAARDVARLRALAVRGTRYTLALFVPLCVTLMVLAKPLLEVWLGARYGDGATALAILVSYWLLYGGLIVTPGFLVGVGRARQVGRVFAGAAVLNLALALLLTPELGLEGPALATAIPFCSRSPCCCTMGLTPRAPDSASWPSAPGCPLTRWAPCSPPRSSWRDWCSSPRPSPPSVVLASGGVLAYWAIFYAVVLDAGERAVLIRRR